MIGIHREYELEYNINKSGNVVRENGKVLRTNVKTVWVKAPDGRPIKRHKVKHNVVLLAEE